jgi:ADP-heptose:LPS heptosyltransferase
MPHSVYCFLQFGWNIGIKRKELLVIDRTQGLGDFLCMMWSVSAVRAKYANAWTVLVCPPDCRQLATYAGMCDVASNAGNPFNRFIRAVCSPELYFSPTNPDERNPPEPRLRRHLAEEAAEFLGVTCDPNSLRFIVPHAVRRRMAERISKVNPNRAFLVVVHCGPSWPVKEWPIERWTEFIQKLLAQGNVLVVQIGVDFEPYRQIIRRSRIPQTIDWVNKLDLADITALLEQTDVFVGIDSGPIHLATTVGVPTIALFGPTEGKLHLHPRARSVILSGKMPCLGCHHLSTGPAHWRTGCPNDINCMKGISADQVFKATEELLRATQCLPTRLRNEKDESNCDIANCEIGRSQFAASTNRSSFRKNAL